MTSIGFSDGEEGGIMIGIRRLSLGVGSSTKVFDISPSSKGLVVSMAWAPTDLDRA